MPRLLNFSAKASAKNQALADVLKSKLFPWSSAPSRGENWSWNPNPLYTAQDILGDHFCAYFCKHVTWVSNFNATITTPLMKITVPGWDRLSHAIWVSLNDSGTKQPTKLQYNCMYQGLITRYVQYGAKQSDTKILWAVLQIYVALISINELINSLWVQANFQQLLLDCHHTANK